MGVAESARHVDKRSICGILTTVDTISGDTERRAVISAIVEPLVFKRWTY